MESAVQACPCQAMGSAQLVETGCVPHLLDGLGSGFGAGEVPRGVQRDDLLHPHFGVPVDLDGEIVGDQVLAT